MRVAEAATWLLGQRDLGLQAVGLHGCIVERLLGLNAGLLQFARAVKLNLAHS